MTRPAVSFRRLWSRPRTPRPGATAVYRLYDRDNTLLYVGISNRPDLRFKQHAADKPWWPQVFRREVRMFRTRSQALRAEEVAIRSERPLYNIVHNEANPRRVRYRKIQSARRTRRIRWVWPGAWNVTAVSALVLAGAAEGWWRPGVWLILASMFVVGLSAWVGWKRVVR